MDKGQPETQSSWFLDEDREEKVYITCALCLASDSARLWDGYIQIKPCHLFMCVCETILV